MPTHLQLHRRAAAGQLEYTPKMTQFRATAGELEHISKNAAFAYPRRYLLLGRWPEHAWFVGGVQRDVHTVSFTENQYQRLEGAGEAESAFETEGRCGRLGLQEVMQA